MTRLLLAVALTTLPATIHAQTGPLQIHTRAGKTEIELSMHQGHAAYPARALERIGAEISSNAGAIEVTIFGDTIRFHAHSPFIQSQEGPWQLVSSVYDEGGVLYLPRQVFTEWLPERYPQHLRYQDGTLRRVRSTAETERNTTRRERAADTPKTNSTRVVILDPGHGGRDPGKIGPTGIREKDVVLEIAKRTAAILEKRDGYEVYLTRTSDTLPSLADRPHIANRWKDGRPSALFISIHANAHHTQARGFETFLLSDARTEDERRVAEMENAAIAYEEPEHLPPADDLDWILNNLRNDFYLRASHDLASLIQAKLGRIHPGPNRGVKQAGFRVLVGAFMPAVLVETAFITHHEEERLLGSSTFQDQLAQSLAEAITEFFEELEYRTAANEQDSETSVQNE